MTSDLRLCIARKNQSKRGLRGGPAHAKVLKWEQARGVCGAERQRCGLPGTVGPGAGQDAGEREAGPREA